MNSRKVRFSYLKHKAIAMAAIVIIGTMFIALKMVTDSGVIESGVFIWMAIQSFSMELNLNANSSGYGVNERVNALVGEKLFHEFGASEKFATPDVVFQWILAAVLSLGTISIGFAVTLLWGDTRSVKLFGNGSILVGTAILCSIAAAIYVWTMADRHRRYYLGEGLFVATLLSHQYPEARIEQLVKEARTQELLISL